VTGTEHHPIDACAHCGGRIAEKKAAAYFVEDIPPPQKKSVVKHIVEKGRCSSCGRWSATEPLPHAPVVLGQNVQRYVTYLSVICRQSYRQIQTFCSMRMTSHSPTEDKTLFGSKERPKESKRSKPSTVHRTLRMTLEMPPNVVEHLDQVKQDTGAMSYADVIRTALRLYYGLTKEAKQGHNLVIEREDGTDRQELKIFL
jgi:hypothetical protein